MHSFFLAACQHQTAWQNQLLLMIHPSIPSNFRPIALTSCIGKVFTSILRNRLLSFLVDNHNLNSNVQKAFMPGVPGCLEHQFTLTAVLSEARKKHKSLAVAWLDLANAYGSVHHALIQFSLQHYNVPSEISSLVNSLYCNLSASIHSPEWTTETFPLKIGVYQGDPLSVNIFNCVINTLVDTIQRRVDLGYILCGAPTPVNLLQYADDIGVMSGSVAGCQHLLTLVDKWLQWSGMRAKIPKCHALEVRASTGQVFDPQLLLANDNLPFLGNNSLRFLGLEIQISSDPMAARKCVFAVSGAHASEG